MREASGKGEGRTPVQITFKVTWLQNKTHSDLPASSNAGEGAAHFKDMDFRNNMQKVYVTEEQKEKIMEKLNRDVEVED